MCLIVVGMHMVSIVLPNLVFVSPSRDGSWIVQPVWAQHPQRQRHQWELIMRYRAPRRVFISGIRVSSLLVCLFFTMQAHQLMSPPLPPPRSDYSHEGDHVCKLCRCSLIWSRLIWHSPPLWGCVPGISEKNTTKKQTKNLMLKQHVTV